MFVWCYTKGVLRHMSKALSYVKKYGGVIMTLYGKLLKEKKWCANQGWGNWCRSNGFWDDCSDFDDSRDGSNRHQ